MNSHKIVGGLAALILVVTFIWIVDVTPMDLFKEIPKQAKMSSFSEASLKTAGYLWDERVMDVVSQALVIFSAIMCALTLFRGKEVD